MIGAVLMLGVMLVCGAIFFGDESTSPLWWVTAMMAGIAGLLALHGG